MTHAECGRAFQCYLLHRSFLKQSASAASVKMFRYLQCWPCIAIVLDQHQTLQHSRTQTSLENFRRRAASVEPLKKKKLVMFLRTLFGAAPGTSKWEPHPCVCARHLRDCCCLTFLARHRPQHLAFGQSKPSSLTVSETELLTTHLCGGRKTMHLYSCVCVRRGRRGRGVFVSVHIW